MKRRDFIRMMGSSASSAAETKTSVSEKKEEKKEETKTATDEKITLSIYTQYADDDTKVPYDYAVEQLAIAYPNVELNLIVQAVDTKHRDIHMRILHTGVFPIS